MRFGYCTPASNNERRFPKSRQVGTPGGVRGMAATAFAERTDGAARRPYQATGSPVKSNAATERRGRSWRRPALRPSKPGTTGHGSGTGGRAGSIIGYFTW